MSLLSLVIESVASSYWERFLLARALQPRIVAGIHLSEDVAIIVSAPRLGIWLWTALIFCVYQRLQQWPKTQPGSSKSWQVQELSWRTSRWKHSNYHISFYELSEDSGKQSSGCWLHSAHHGLGWGHDGEIEEQLKEKVSGVAFPGGIRFHHTMLYLVTFPFLAFTAQGKEEWSQSRAFWPGAFKTSDSSGDVAVFTPAGDQWFTQTRFLFKASHSFIRGSSCIGWRL